MNKTYGILMSSQMIRAYQDGRKTQTRRTRGLDVINKAPDEFEFKGFHPASHRAIFEFRLGSEHLIRPPYGFDGDRLYFKETYAPMCSVADVGGCDDNDPVHEKEHHYVEYRADTGNPYPGDWPEEEAKGNDEAPKWKSSMFMPRKYARFSNIPIKLVSVERLHDITFNDAYSEGCPKDRAMDGIAWYRDLWDSLNGKKLPWIVNPWVWVYEFPKHTEGEVK